MPLPGYHLFLMEKHNELKREPGWLHRTGLEHNQIFAEEWQQLSKERNVPYMEAAAKGRAVYKKKMFRFFKNHPKVLDKELAKLKKDTKEKATAAKRPTDHAPDPDDVPLSQVIRLDSSSAAGKNKEPVASTSKSLRLSTESVPLPLNTRRTPSRALDAMDYESEIKIQTNLFASGQVDHQGKCFEQRDAAGRVLQGGDTGGLD
ncbi:uncharacterized protein LOC111073817 [Drosophila obscura]|uniref:uncharacterized protein LOC111073817 n=1 Tax=Drosophila obscura TaxID=7282 RepID=UPI001BB0F9B9|nr:uncharacterized protein LOC111073817 [Drosophila obscura]